MNPRDKEDNNRENLAARPQVSYGSTESTSINNNNDDIPVAPVLSPEPPKPAVRQRILKKTALPSADLSGAPDDETYSGIINEAFEGRNDETHKQQLEQSAPSSSVPNLRGNQSRGLRQIESDNSIPLISKNGAVLPMPTQTISLPDLEERPYPKKVFFIIANEFCERFSYYGLRGVLVLYFKSVLDFSDSTATVAYHSFVTMAYLTPILGAILADTIWGKFKTILYLSMVYLLGEIVLVGSSIFWDLDDLAIALTVIGLLLISVGTGGIKPCVSALGGDQFLASETSRRESFFSVFYGAINLGALISMFLTPLFRSRYQCFGRSDCYPFAFGVPSVLMLISIIFFLLAAKHYVIVPLPKENVILAFCRCSWLAFKRKLAGHKLVNVSINQPLSNSASTLNEDISLSSENAAVVPANSRAVDIKVGAQQQQLPNMRFIDEEQQSIGRGQTKVAATKASTDGSQRTGTKPTECFKEHDRDHWLYLSADRFDSGAIEDFRSVWRVILLLAPTPVYWCLFDQQSSLWTLQATRMDGQITKGFTLEPDQMTVANPVLLLLSIPFVRLIVYPAFNKCNMLKNPISKMTAGMVVAALTFMASAWIELQIQQNQPMEIPNHGYANLLLVNGLPDCSIVEPTITYAPIPNQLMPVSAITNNGSLPLNSSLAVLPYSLQQQTVPIGFSRLEPLRTTRLDLLSTDQHNNSNTYQIKFKLSNDLERLMGASRTDNSSSLSSTTNFVGCPFNLTKDNEFTLGPLSNQAVKLMYVEQGNGKLTYKVFDDSIKLPSSGMARVRLLFEFFGSIVQAEKRQFSLVRLSSTPEERERPHPELAFNLTQRNGQVLMSDYIEVAVPSRGDMFSVKTNDNLMNNSNFSIKLDAGTRNLIIIQQLGANQVEVRAELLQGNEYRISILYQFIPYLMISLSEVMFSITALELAYSMAPETMRSIVLALPTVALGNILTVIVESIHPFDNVVHDFLFYAALMFLDICLFAWIGYHYRPHSHEENHSGKNRSAKKRAPADNNIASKQSS